MRGVTERRPPNFRDALDRARALRRRQTDAEARLWRRLRDRRLFGARFRRQHAIGSRIVDFFCMESKLAVEIDGGGHALGTAPTQDLTRDFELEASGIRVLRFWNGDVLQNVDGVLEVIANALGRPSP